MITAGDIQQRNQVALDRRNEIWRHNPRPGFDITALSAMPPYLGLVDAPLFPNLTFVMFLSNNDDGVALRWLWNGCYEPMSLGLWTLLASQASVLFDIGAHTGVYTLAALAANPDAKVISCEPHDLNYARLLVNLRANGFATDMAYSIAISDRDADVPFTVSTEAWYLSTGGVVRASTDAISRHVPAMRLDTICQRNSVKISLVKIDTEGHELAVLRGARAVLRDSGPDILMESVFNETTEELEHLLRSEGYSYYLIDDDTFELRPVNTLAPVVTAGVPAMGQLNRFVTKRNLPEVRELAERLHVRLQAHSPKCESSETKKGQA